MLQALKNNAVEAIASLKKLDSKYQKNWKMIDGGKTVMDTPKINVLRSVVLNRLPNHRAQLGVYFRLMDIPVLDTYGPTADES